MSATLGNIDEFAELMGMEPDDYVGLRLDSTFDFEASPIYNCKSGWLNYKNFDSNIDKIVMDTIKICNTYHPQEKGIIHTATFKIGQLLKDKIHLGLVPDKSRFLFYSTAEEKEKAVELMKNSTKPYIIVGPSLYEGLDLKDSQGRFNIIMKVPYAALSPYVKKKMERIPFWYARNTKEKITQGIGRTNRHTNDYSKVYLLDTMFDKIIWECGDDITARIKSKNL
jgi:Rad3-related DNA helicase